ncbi:MAG: 4Fe-4S ferredoxin [Candidatus Margulisiibacteriota bacterium]|nr:MAG: hypothetical protein A2X43_12050 [Candidatus Margulisbacteria bacterium GWD2_39_127]OGI03188.1 MAG: hypothetical protein A2X42_11290 [Candidatus Margulisbacteria bacterium GWF2_38_17]OGI11212.1 MAG: hypothetical protein A2X41_03715 [Candidatus Margulisbacteria bacterium GWE2_39_32]PZM78572.1 MAG: 4Fe-4S ferredoxin [Candidatus Margulisiibacteriota bacterium]HAR63860.1 4Fe-4S ferredoxin [Candidatus Margulisiibacteriota bacterium]
MVLRKFIDIDEAKCDGCGNCVVACAEGALRIIDGKARVIKEQFCDGLGACIGECPKDALKIVTRDVARFDETAVEKHLKENRKVCPGTAVHEFRDTPVVPQTPVDAAACPSQLRQWPVQLHLVSPAAGYFQGANLLIAADCCAFSYGNFHRDFVKDRAVVIACPKLDDTEGYIEKLVNIIKEGNVSSITVVIMQVPCCRGLARIAQEALKRANRPIPYSEKIISIKGEVSG